MRHLTFIALLTVLLSTILYSGCEKYQCNCSCSDEDAEELTLNDTIDYKYSKLYCNAEYEIQLSFDSITDGRCPIGAMCVWEGNASVKLLIKQDGENDASFTLNTFDGFLTDTTVNGIHYELIDMLPYPVIDKDYQLDDYILQLQISD